MSNPKQLSIVKIAGVSYFALLGLINMVATFYFSSLGPVDFIILILCALPMLFSRRNLLLQAAGFLGLFISLYMGFAALTFNSNPASTTSQTEFNMGYVFIVSCLLASIALIVAGSQSRNENRVLTNTTRA
jgi:membrane-bound ClpP family serine protease